MNVSTKLLLVEGNDDKRFFIAFLRKLAIDNVHIESYGGKDNLSRAIHALSKRPDFSQFTSIGVTRDADDKTGSIVFNSICAMLKKSQLSVPSNFGKFTKNLLSPCFGIFVMPGENEKGELEDLVFKTLNDEKKLKDCVAEYVTCAKTKGLKVRKPAKSHLYAWLSCQDSPALRLGEAADQGLFDFGHECLNGLSQFLKDLGEN